MSLYANWPSYPKVLTKSEWDKQKGVVAKVVKKETGIGAKLDEGERAFDAIKAYLFSDSAVDTSTKAACRKARTEAGKEFNGAVKTFANKMLEIRQLAEQRAAEFKKNVLVPKSSREYLERVANEAQHFTDAVRGHCTVAAADIQKAEAAATV